MPSTLVSGTITSADLIVDAEGIRTATTKPTTATAYKRGDLLVISNSNVATLATDPAVWNAIAAVDVSAAQATSHVTNGNAIPIYTQGAFDLDAVYLSGVLLASNQKDAARAAAIKNRIELRKVGG